MRINWAEKAGKVAGKIIKSATEMLQISGMDWEVEKVQNHIHDIKTGKLIKNENSFAMVRKDTGDILGDVGRIYKPFQNWQLANWADSLREFADVSVSNCGEFGGGKRVWISLNLNDTKEWNFSGLKVFPKFFLGNSHDGSKNLTLHPSTFDPICANTLEMLFKEKVMVDGFRIRHTSEINENAEIARKLILNCNAAWKEMQEDLTRMASFTAPRSVIDDLIAEVWGNPAEIKEGKAKTIFDRNHAAVMSIRASRQGERGNSLWADFSAITEVMDHESTIKIGEGDSKKNESEVRFESNNFGRVAKEKANLFKFALEYAN